MNKQCYSYVELSLIWKIFEKLIKKKDKHMPNQSEQLCSNKLAQKQDKM